MREFVSSERIAGAVRRRSRLVSVYDEHRDLVVERRHDRILIIERSAPGSAFPMGQSIDLSEDDARALHEELARLLTPAPVTDWTA